MATLPKIPSSTWRNVRKPNWLIICWLQRNIECSGSAVFNCLPVCQRSSQSSRLFAVAALGNREIARAGLLYSILQLEPSQHWTLRELNHLTAPFLHCSNYNYIKMRLSHHNIPESDMSILVFLRQLWGEVLVVLVCTEGESFSVRHRSCAL